MDRQPKKKSVQLKELENIFEQRTRRFSPFVILGLRDEEGTVEGNSADTVTESQHTHMGVDNTPPQDIAMGVVTTPMASCPTPTQVVVKYLDNLTTTESNTHMGVDNTPTQDIQSHPIDEQETRSSAMGVVTTPIRDIQNHSTVVTTPMVITSQEQATQNSSTPKAVLRMRDVVAASNFRAQISKKARDVLSYLNSVRSEKSELTMPVGYGQISGATNVDPHYLRRNVLPKLMMLGLISIVHKTMQGTSYRLHYDLPFAQIWRQIPDCAKLWR